MDDRGLYIAKLVKRDGQVVRRYKTAHKTKLGAAIALATILLIMPFLGSAARSMGHRRAPRLKR